MQRVTTTFADRLRGKRCEYRLKQSELARKIGVTENAVNNWECKRSVPSVTNFEHLCIVLHTDPNYLLGWEQR